MEDYFEFVRQQDEERERRIRAYAETHADAIREDNAKTLVGCFERYDFTDYDAFFKLKEWYARDTIIECRKLRDALYDYFRYTRGIFLPTIDQIKRVIEEKEDEREDYELSERLLRVF